MRIYKVVTQLTRVCRIQQCHCEHYYGLETTVCVESIDSDDDVFWAGKLIREGSPVIFCCDVFVADSQIWEVADIFGKCVTEEVQAEVDKGRLVKVPHPLSKSDDDVFANWKFDEDVLRDIAERVGARMKLLEGDKIKQAVLCYHDLV